MSSFLNSKNKYNTLAYVTLLALLPIAAAFAALCIGRIPLSPKQVFDYLLSVVSGGETDAYLGAIIVNMRIPRIILALLAGAGLSVSGCVFQSLFANPLATPDTLGVASGAGFGAVLGIVVGFELVGVQLLSFAFGIAAVALTYAVGYGKRRNGRNSAVLGGIMIGSLFNALISLVKFTADTETELPAITYWLMGNLDGANYRSLTFGCVPIIVGIAVLWLLRWRLNLLPLGDEEARSTGVNVKALRAAAVLCATAVTASCVSMCGQVGWVGLLVPHMCRMKLGNNHMRLLPATVFVGAAFLVVVDTFARSVSAAELPVSVLTAIVGAPFFIALMTRSEGGSL